MVSEVEHPFVISDVWVSSVTCLLVSWAHFPIGWFVFFFLVCRDFLHILTTNPLSVAHTAVSAPSPW